MRLEAALQLSSIQKKKSCLIVREGGRVFSPQKVVRCQYPSHRLSSRSRWSFQHWRGRISQKEELFASSDPHPCEGNLRSKASMPDWEAKQGNHQEAMLGMMGSKQKTSILTDLSCATRAQKDKMCSFCETLNGSRQTIYNVRKHAILHNKLRRPCPRSVTRTNLKTFSDQFQTDFRQLSDRFLADFKPI